MISSCVSCGKVLAKYPPTSEVSWELCDDCVHAQRRNERKALSCGQAECPYPEVPYECLRQAAASAPLDCPALRYSGA